MAQNPEVKRIAEALVEKGDSVLNAVVTLDWEECASFYSLIGPGGHKLVVASRGKKKEMRPTPLHQKVVAHLKGDRA